MNAFKLSKEDLDALRERAGRIQPLWAGTDETFTAEIREIFKIPGDLREVLIAPPSPCGDMTAISIRGGSGALTLLLTFEPHGMTISPLYLSLTGRAEDFYAGAFDADRVEQAINGVLMRHISQFAARFN